MALNKQILEAITHLNQFQGKGYHWDPKGQYHGSYGDVLWDEKIILKGDPEGKTYCCGLTFHAYLLACKAVGKYLGNHSELVAMRNAWFCATGKTPAQENKGAVDALVPGNHGLEITLGEAEPGDLVQLWRKGGSGHSVIFIANVIDNGVTGIKYWSTQPATNGIGYRTEYFDGVQNPITHIHICRAI